MCTEHTGICLISVWHHGTSDWNFSSKTFYSNTCNTCGCLLEQLLHWSYRGQTQRERLRWLKHLLGGYTCNNVQIHFVFTSGGLLNTHRLHIKAQHVWGTRLLCPAEKDSCFCFSSSPSLPLQQTSVSHLRRQKTHTHAHPHVEINATSVPSTQREVVYRCVPLRLILYTLYNPVNLAGGVCSF